MLDSLKCEAIVIKRHGTWTDRQLNGTEMDSDTKRYSVWDKMTPLISGERWSIMNGVWELKQSLGVEGGGY